MKLRDAHCHYHFASLAPFVEAALKVAREAGLASAVVNGTCQQDWPVVRDFVRKYPWTRAAYGIHPWRAAGRTASWERELVAFLEEDEAASVGEIGLDALVPGNDPADQLKLFRRQWEIARAAGRPASVHCVRAWEPLRQFLKNESAPGPGFLIHAWNGPPAWIPFFAGKGAYFSFSPYFMLERKRPQRVAFAEMPRDRILIETDAPDLGPPPECNLHPLTDGSGGKPLNHPANLTVALNGLAEMLGLEPEEAAELTGGNWARLFDIGRRARAADGRVRRG